MIFDAKQIEVKRQMGLIPSVITYSGTGLRTVRFTALSSKCLPGV